MSRKRKFIRKKIKPALVYFMMKCFFLCVVYYKCEMFTEFSLWPQIIYWNSIIFASFMFFLTHLIDPGYVPYDPNDPRSSMKSSPRQSAKDSPSGKTGCHRNQPSKVNLLSILPVKDFQDPSEGHEPKKPKLQANSPPQFQKHDLTSGKVVLEVVSCEPSYMISNPHMSMAEEPKEFFGSPISSPNDDKSTSPDGKSPEAKTVATVPNITNFNGEPIPIQTTFNSPPKQMDLKFQQLNEEKPEPKEDEEENPDTNNKSGTIAREAPTKTESKEADVGPLRAQIFSNQIAITQPKRMEPRLPGNIETAKETYIEKRYCRICHIDQPIRAKHCADCNRCVATFDHHCPWIGTCIAEFNHGMFYVYLVAEMIELIFSIIYVGILCCRDPFPLTFESILFNLPEYLALLLTLIFVCMVSGLLILHTYLLSVNLTTWERLSWQKITYLKDWSQNLGSPFDFGFRKNIRLLCFNDYEGEFYTWKIPQLN